MNVQTTFALLSDDNISKRLTPTIMPKEITHWLVAEEARKRCSFPLHIGLVRLGAIFHDVLYYARSGGASEIRRCTKVANALHGTNGEDTFALLRYCIAIIKTVEGTRESNNQQLWAFTLGIISHICTDIAFHPYIYYASGNCLDEATHFAAWHNHRALESAIDLAFCHRAEKKPYDFWLQSDIAYNKQALSAIVEHLATFQREKGGMDIHGKDYERGYATLTRLRGYFASGLLNLAFDTIEPLVVPILSKVLPETYSHLGLRYSKRSVWSVPDVDAPLHYLHPVTGEAQTATLQTLFETAVQETVRVLGLLDKALIFREALLPVGQSLDVGLPEVSVSAMQYFAPLPRKI
jgi:hypothetical protein